jgi:hypothetical protein
MSEPKSYKRPWSIDNMITDLYIYDMSEKELRLLAKALQIDYKSLSKRADLARQRIMAAEEN